VKGISKCPKCGSLVQPHRICANCGFYKGKEHIDVLAKLTKKEAKKKKREIESGAKDAKKELDPKELSKK
jgi:large subunit ribosomal protein L32